jgi:hypothetical protein
LSGIIGNNFFVLTESDKVQSAIVNLFRNFTFKIDSNAVFVIKSGNKYEFLNLYNKMKLSVLNHVGFWSGINSSYLNNISSYEHQSNLTGVVIRSVAIVSIDVSAVA